MARSSKLPLLDVVKASTGKSKEKDPLAVTKAQTENVAAKAKLAEMGYDAASKIPSVHDARASTIAGLKKDLGDKPSGGLAMLAGLYDGMELAEKEKSIFESKDRLKKYQGTLGKLEQVVEESGKRLAEFRQAEKVKTGLSPYVSSTLDLIGENAPQERIDLAGIDLVKRYNAFTGENWQYEMGNGRGIAVTNSQTGENKIIPWEELTTPELDYKALMVNPIYQSQLVRQQQMEDKELAISQQNADAHTMSAEAKKNKYAPQPTPDLKEGELPLNSFSGEFRKDYESGVLKNFQKIPQNQQAIKTVQEMARIFGDHPDIGQSFIQLLDTKEDNILTVFGKRYAESKHPGLLAAMQKLRKLASDLSLDVILSVPGKTATDVFKQTVKDAAPNGKLTKEGFDSIAQNWITKANNNIQGATQGLQDLHRGVINANSASMASPSSDQGGKAENDKVLVKTPDGVGYISKAEYDAIIAKQARK